MEAIDPDLVAMNVFWSAIVCAGGFSFVTYIVVF